MGWGKDESNNNGVASTIFMGWLLAVVLLRLWVFAIYSACVRHG
jgi:hypothetical protein